MALTKIKTEGVTDDAITSGKIPANAVGSSEIADTAVTLAKLEHGTSSNDGKFLRANNGADPTFESISTRAGRNLVINGAMQVAQRGTSSSSWSGIGFPACDRQKTLGSYGGNWTISQSTEAPSDNGFTKSTKYDCTTAVTSLNANAYLQHYYRIEGQDLQGVCKGTSNAKPLILSFWVKTNKTGTYNVEAIDQDNSRLCTFAYTVANTNWNKYTVVFPADTTGAFGNDNGASLDIGWWLVAGSTFNTGSNQNSFGSFVQANRAPSNVNLADSTSNEWYITGIQLEIDHTGSGKPTDFEHRSFGQELALCQRYCHKWKASDGSGNYQNVGVGYGYDSSKVAAHLTLPVRMRAAPSMTTSGNFRVVLNGTSKTFSALELNRSHPVTPYLRGTGGSSITQGHIGEFGANNDSSFQITFDAEL